MLRSMSDPPFITLTISRLSVSGSCSAHEKRCMHGQVKVCLVAANGANVLASHQIERMGMILTVRGDEFCNAPCTGSYSALNSAHVESAVL